MKLTEIINAFGEGKVAVQELAPCITKISTSRKARGASAVTFLTTHLQPIDAIVPGGEVGIVIWIKREDIPESMR
jgi:hypothetical protein